MALRVDAKVADILFGLATQGHSNQEHSGPRSARSTRSARHTLRRPSTCQPGCTPGSVAVQASGGRRAI
eukprot:scaffold5770_cov388-Prasinococcus_capsulatus_cf.AAC.11